MVSAEERILPSVGHAVEINVEQVTMPNKRKFIGVIGNMSRFHETDNEPQLGIIEKKKKCKRIL